MKIFASGNLSQRWLDRFREHFELDYYDWGSRGEFLPEDEFIQRLQGASILITEADEVTGTIMDSAPDLALIIDCRAATVNVDVKAATERGIVVCNTPGRNADAVADLTIAMMVMVLRKVWPGLKHLHDGTWHEWGFDRSYLWNRGHELPEKTVGLIGLGAVGRKVAYRLQGFDVTLLGYDPFVSQADAASLGIEMAGLDDLLIRSDIVSLHAPITPQTKGMIGRREFELMKPSAYFINTARAVLVDEAALIEALTNHRIAGAALDVFHQEPLPADYVLFTLPNVVALPHIGGATFEVTDHHSRIAYQTLMSFLDGKPVNVVNPEALASAQARLGTYRGSVS